ncbi:flavodoxin family protein [Chloroflexota bacterium]
MEIKVLGVCGTPVKRRVAKGPTNTEVLLNAVLDSCKEQGDVETDAIFPVEDGFKEGCNQDNWCLKKQTETKICAFNDVMTNEYYAKIIAADAMVISTPVYVGRMCALTAAFIDRLRALEEGKHWGFRGVGPALKDKVLGACAVAWYRHAGVETTLLTTLYLPSGIFGMIPVGSGPERHAWASFGYGAGGASIGKMDELANVKNDEYAMRSAKGLGKRVVEMARIVKAGKEALAKGLV